jgi:trans-2,3-dihydro-3-hydroxyanthranilate isomerase
VTVSLEVTLVQACGRSGHGGSRTAVVEETELGVAERRAIPAATKASHVVFVSTSGNSPSVSMRFFTAAGELPACGHGTVAALAVIAARAQTARREMLLRAGGRQFTGRVTGSGNNYEAMFEPGPVALRPATAAERDLVVSAVGAAERSTVAGCQIAAVGRPRMLVEIADRQALAELAPDMSALRGACDRLGLLGCYVYTTPAGNGQAAARMFAPSIGVPEDIANANSTACLAALLVDRFQRLTVDMGDSLGEPATIVATSRRSPTGPVVNVGGSATIGPAVTLGDSTSRP